MRRLLVLLPVLSAVQLAGEPAGATTFVLDKQHTEVRFTWDHLGVSRQSGRASDVSGTLDLDPANPEAASVAIEIKAASLQTGVAKLDSLLTTGKDYFDTAQFPAITFKSSSVHMTGDKSADVSGQLTMNGISKPVSLAVHWNYLGPHPLAASNPTFQAMTLAGFSARTQILRSDWEISRMAPLISDEIRISIETEWRAEP